MRNIVTFFTARTNATYKDLAALALVFGISFFQLLGRLPLMEPDEGRYSEIPREMLERGDFITPTLNYVKYFEKPPLHYWLNALSMSTFGQNEFAARLPGTLCGLLTLLFTYHLGKKLFQRETGVMAAVILGSTGGFLVQSRINLTDVTLTFCMTLCLGSFILAIQEQGSHKNYYYYLGYAGAALAVLTKGLIGILFPAAIIFLFLLFRRQWRLLGEMHLVTGLFLFLAIASPWFILVSLKNPEFPRFFFIHEHFERFLTKVHRRYQPAWFFLPVLVGTMFHWSLFIPEGLRRAWRDRHTAHGSTLLYLAIWVMFIFAFFSKSNSKLVPYILPIFPPLALLIAWRWQLAVQEGLRSLRGYSIAVGILFVVAGLALPIYPFLAAKNDLGATGGFISGSIFILGSVGVYLALRHKDPLRLFMLVTGCSCLFGVIPPHFIIGNLAERRTVKPLAVKAAELATPDAIIASFGYDQGLPFYAKRRSMVVGNPGELEFGSRQGDNSAWFVDPALFYRLWDGAKPVYAIMGQHDLEALQKGVTTPVRVVMKTRRKVLATNRPDDAALPVRASTSQN